MKLLTCIQLTDVFALMKITSSPFSFPKKKRKGKKRSYTWNKTDINNDSVIDSTELMQLWCFKYLLIHREDDNKLSEDGHKVQEEVNTMPSFKNKEQTKALKRTNKNSAIYSSLHSFFIMHHLWKDNSNIYILDTIKWDKIKQTSILSIYWTGVKERSVIWFRYYFTL